MNLEVERLRSARIEWQTLTEQTDLFSVLFENKTVLLRLNDFPYESLCTVIMNGRETDLEIFPATWSIVS